MRLRQRRQYMYRALLAAVIVCVGWTVVATPSRSDEPITDDMLLQMLGKSHDVMQDQRERLRNIMDGFLIGDTTLIRRNTDELARAMSRVRREFPAKPGQEEAVWKTMSDSVKATRALKEAVRNEDYRTAYDHFTSLMSRCLECHQVRRSWGQFLATAPQPQPHTQRMTPAASDDENPTITIEIIE